MRRREPESVPASGSEETVTGHIYISLFGTFSLRKDGKPMPGWEHPRLQQFLAYLALHRDAPISRQQLAFHFWPDSTDQQALKNVRTMLTRLRQALPEANAFVQVSARAIQWRAVGPVTLDVAVFETAVANATAAQAAGDDAGATQAWAAAVDAYAGDLLPGCYDDWILPFREQYHRAFGDALERLVLLMEEHREYSGGLPYARRLLNHDPLSEAAYQHLIRLHLALGERTEALRACRACQTMLEHEFGTGLSRTTQYLYKRLLQAEDAPGRFVLEQPPGADSSGFPLVGRRAEWSRLISAWHAAAGGQPQIVLISGEAGIGKTRLAREFCAWVDRQGGCVAEAHCYPAGGAAITYAPVVEWLRARALQSRLAGLEDVWLVEIARIFPALLSGRPHLKSPGPLSEAWQRTRLFEALARAVVAPDAPEPTLLFLDDLQWCDQETLDWLGYLLRFAANAPLLMVATVRKYEIDRVHPLMSFWLSLTRSGLLSEITLAPLDGVETGLLAANVAGRAMDASEVARIYQHTEGNPLFIVEIMQARGVNEGADGDLAADSPPGGARDLPLSFPLLSSTAAFPPRVRTVIEWRLAQLSPGARALAQIAAVIGRNFQYEVLLRASGQDEETLLAGLEELWQRQIVRARDAADYDFSHDGIRVVVYDETSPFRRRDAHLRVAQALEEYHRGDVDAFSSQIAGHYEQAGQVSQAIAFYRRAAAAAKSVYAGATAARLYQHLLESELSTGLTRREKCDLMLALAEVWRVTGDWAQAESISRDALVEAEALGDTRLLALAKSALADVLHRLGYYDAALRWLAEAEQGFQQAGEVRGQADAIRIRGEIHWLRGDLQQALAAFERQLQMATEMDDPQRISAAQEAIGLVLWSQGDWEQAAEHCLQSIRIASPLEYTPILTRASLTLGNIRSGEHWYGEAVYWYQHASALARAMNDRQALSWAIYNIAQILARRGDYARAWSGFARSLRNAGEMGDRWTACLNVARLAEVHEHLGRAGEAEALYRLAIQFGSRLGIHSYLSAMQVGLARLLLAQGRLDEARSACAEALAQNSGLTGERLAGEDPRFEARVLGIRLRFATGERTRAEAAAELGDLRASMEEAPRQAALCYTLWRLTPQDEAARAAAAALYRAEYAETWAEECRQRYFEMTGETLPDPPPLPDISEFIPDPGEPVDIEPILAQMRSLLA